MPSQDAFQLFRKKLLIASYCVKRGARACGHHLQPDMMRQVCAFFMTFHLHCCISHCSVTIYACTTFLFTGSLISCANTTHLKVHSFYPSFLITLLTWSSLHLSNKTISEFLACCTNCSSSKCWCSSLVLRSFQLATH